MTLQASGLGSSDAGVLLNVLLPAYKAACEVVCAVGDAADGIDGAMEVVDFLISQGEELVEGFHSTEESVVDFRERAGLSAAALRHAVATHGGVALPPCLLELAGADAPLKGLEELAGADVFWADLEAARQKFDEQLARAQLFFTGLEMLFKRSMTPTIRRMWKTCTAPLVEWLGECPEKPEGLNECKKDEEEESEGSVSGVEHENSVQTIVLVPEGDPDPDPDAIDGIPDLHDTLSV